MAYIGKSPDGTGVRSRFYYTQTSGGGTSVTGSSDDGTTLTFSDGAYVDVFLNGVLLVAGTDYNTTTANTIAGLAALANGDVIEVVVYDIFTVADTVSSLNGGTFSNNVTINGDLTVDTNALFVDASAGSVGISTSSPVANLEIEDGGTSNNILTKITADDQNPYAFMVGNDTYSTTDTNAFGFLQRNDGAAYIYNAGSMRLVVDTDGDLGIGGTPGNIRFKISNTENKITQFIHTSNGSYSDNILEMETARGQSDVFNHVLIRTNNRWQRQQRRPSWL